MSIFEVFKIVLGIVIGIFFLFFLLNFTGLYSGFQQEAIDATHLKNLGKTMRSVLVSDTDLDVDMKIDVFYRPPDIITRTQSSTFEIELPFLFFLRSIQKEKAVVYKSSIDQGFFDLEFVGVLPKTKILYNPVIQEPETYKTLNKISRLFPSTDKPEIRFGFCTAGYETSVDVNKDQLITDYTGVLEDEKILDQVKSQLNFQVCTAKFTNKILIIFGDKPQDNGFVIKPFVEGTGEIFFSDNVLVYKDELDILAVITGGGEAYRYKNKLQLDLLEIASRKEAERLDKLATLYSDPIYRKDSCMPLYSEAKIILFRLNSKVRDMIGIKNLGLQDAVEFNRNMEQGREKYKDLENEGCE